MSCVTTLRLPCPLLFTLTILLAACFRSSAARWSRYHSAQAAVDEASDDSDREDYEMPDSINMAR